MVEATRCCVSEADHGPRRGGEPDGDRVAGAVGVGALLVVGQMVTLGLLTLTTAGGGLAGYLVRARQDRKLLASVKNQPDAEVLPKPKVINALGFDKKKSG